MATVTTQDEFKAALADGAAQIILANDITLTQYSSITYPVIIKAETPSTILFWGNPTTSRKNMLVVSSTGILTLESIILDAENRDGTFVQVNGGTLIINDNVILQNLQSTTAQKAVKIAEGGTLIMNGGKITGIASDVALSCDNGSITMNNNAEISGNRATGIMVRTIGTDTRSSFTMTGNSRVYGNRPTLSGPGGVTVYTADMYMGINEDDAPEVYDNRTRPIDYGGGIMVLNGSTLTMRGNAKIWGNYTDVAGGGILVQASDVTMYDNASIVDNVCTGEPGGGGARINSAVRLILEDNASISNNTSASIGGGVYLHSTSYMEMKGNSRIEGNKGVDGAGIYLGSSDNPVEITKGALIGADNSSPAIVNNISSRYGGGIFIGQNNRLNLTGNSIVNDNQAESGTGIYKQGILNVSKSPRVLDGLFVEGNADNVPVITGQLTPPAEIHLESSEYVSPENVPMVIADKGSEFGQLGESERAAWKIPADFGAAYAVILNAELNRVLIDYDVYEIKYAHLFGALNSNPGSYSAESIFPIVLQAPGERPGYVFTGWYNSAGEPWDEIPEGTLGDLLLVALWREK